MASLAAVPDPEEDEEVTLGGLVAEYDTPGRTDNDIARLLIAACLVRENGVNMLRPAVCEYIANRRRKRVRAIEKRLGALWNPVDQTRSRQAVLADFRVWALAYADSMVSIDGRRRRVGSLTVNEWLVRIGERQAQVAADIEAVARDEAVVANLRAAKKPTLDAYLKAPPTGEDGTRVT